MAECWQPGPVSGWQQVGLYSSDGCLYDGPLSVSASQGDARQQTAPFQPWRYAPAHWSYTYRNHARALSSTPYRSKNPIQNRTAFYEVTWGEHMRRTNAARR